MNSMPNQIQKHSVSWSSQMSYLMSSSWRTSMNLSSPMRSQSFVNYSMQNSSSSTQSFVSYSLRSFASFVVNSWSLTSYSMQSWNC